MKTLDEVIKAWSICFSDNSRSNCTGCPYADEDGEAACFNHDREDALIYLKAYQWQMTNPDGDHLQLEKCRALLSDFYQNEPLSWDELRQMEGKPVWVEGNHGCIWGQKAWSLILLDSENDDIVICINTDNGVHYEFAIGQEDYGTDWQAYRKER